MLAEKGNARRAHMAGNATLPQAGEGAMLVLQPRVEALVCELLILELWMRRAGSPRAQRLPPGAGLNCWRSIAVDLGAAVCAAASGA